MSTRARKLLKKSSKVRARVAPRAKSKRPTASLLAPNSGVLTLSKDDGETVIYQPARPKGLSKRQKQEAIKNNPPPPGALSGHRRSQRSMFLLSGRDRNCTDDDPPMLGTGVQIGEWVFRARRGERKYARRVLQHFIESVRNGDSPHNDVILYIADALERYFVLRGKESLEASLGLAHRRGKADLNSGQDESVVALYEAHAAENPKGAIQRVADELGLKRKQVEHILYGRNK